MKKLGQYYKVIGDITNNNSTDSIRCIENWDDFYRFCSQQALLGMVFGEIEKQKKIDNLPTPLLYRWLADAQQIKFQNQKLNKELAALHHLLNNNGIDYSVVKGQVVASYYQDPELRMSGDVDFYCPGDYLVNAKALVAQKWGVEIEKGDSPYHYHFEHGGVTFEMHFRLFFFHQKRRDAYWLEVLHNAMGYNIKIDDVNVPSLTPTVHALFVFLHLYHHLVEVGVGLRQFCDLAMLLRADINKDELKHHLKELGMTRAFRASEYILTECIGLSSEVLPYKLRTIDRWYGHRMLNVVLYRGNMGHYNKRNGWSGMGHQIESAYIKMGHFAKFFWLSPGYHLGWMGKRLKLINY